MKYFLCLSLVLAATTQVSSFQSGIPSPSAVVRSKNAGGFASVSAARNTPTAKSSTIRFPTTRLSETTADETDAVVERKLDVGAIAKYIAALAIQMGLFTGLFAGLDKVVAATGIRVPFAANFILFYFFALKSRFLNPLQNSRPQVSNKEIKNAEERKMPSWTPPGFIFPIVWLLLIGPLRAATSSMVYAAAGGSYCNVAILSLMLHLSIGDVWNTINNVERRYGTSVLGIVCVYTSAAFAAFQYSQVLPLAGKLLSLKLIWLTIASSLIIQTWRLNKNPDTGKKYSLLPKTGEGSKTEFSWF